MGSERPSLAVPDSAGIRALDALSVVMDDGTRTETLADTDDRPAQCLCSVDIVGTRVGA